jgi:hypothetical protein
MTRLVYAIGAALALGAIGAPNAAASVEVIKQRVVIVRDVMGSDAASAPAFVPPPASAAAPAAAPAPAPRSRPGPRLGVLGKAAVAPAELGARVADFVARAITRGVAGPSAAAKSPDPV